MAEHHKGDLRVKKTYSALYTALFSLLNTRNFNDITVNDLCARAPVSRATFYAHFRDKYDLLQYMLRVVQNQVVQEEPDYTQLRREINGFVRANKRLVSNILTDANGETLALVRAFICAIISRIVMREMDVDANGRCVIFDNFMVGGVVNLLRWHVEHDFPEQPEVMNEYLYELLLTVSQWDIRQRDAQEE